MTLTMGDGVKYFFAGYDKGFSGNSALFCLHDPKNDRFDRPQTIQSIQRGVATDLSSLVEIRKELEQAQLVVSHALAAPTFEDCTPDEIRGWMQVINDGFDRMISIKPRLMRLRHLDRDHLHQVFDSIVEQVRDLSYQKKDIEHFWFDVLCDPGGGKGKRMAEQLQRLQAPLDPDSPEALGF